MAGRWLIACAAAALLAGCGGPKTVTVTTTRTVVERPAYPKTNDYGGTTCPDGSSGNYGGC